MIARSAPRFVSCVDGLYAIVAIIFPSRFGAHRSLDVYGVVFMLLRKCQAIDA